jgi:L-ascorbate metabolism protein UlaG (beta-lactamase superfamily)
MEFQFFGANCVGLITKQAAFIVDDNLASLGLKTVTKPESVSLFTQLPITTPLARLTITDPGEYELSGVSIFGIAARAHTDELSHETATIYKLQHDELRVAIVGHIHSDISEDQLEQLGAVDILIVPVGGNGYTLDAVGAVQLIKKIEPKLVIPTHYEDATVKYPVPQSPLSEFLKVIGVEPQILTAKFKPKPADFTEQLQVVVLNR